MKCPECHSCFDKPIVNNKVYLYCWLCNVFYIWDNQEGKLLDKTEEVKQFILGETSGPEAVAVDTEDGSSEHGTKLDPEKQIIVV